MRRQRLQLVAGFQYVGTRKKLEHGERATDTAPLQVSKRFSRHAVCGDMYNTHAFGLDVKISYRTQGRTAYIVSHGLALSGWSGALDSDSLSCRRPKQACARPPAEKTLSSGGKLFNPNVRWLSVPSGS